MLLGSKAVLNRMSVVVLALAAIYAILLLPGIRPQPGYNSWIDGWLNGLVDFGVVAVLVVRSLVDRRQRAPWLLFSAGLLAALGGSITYYAHYQYLDALPTPAWADIGWLAFYPLLYAGLVLLLLTRVPPRLHSLWLDGLVAGATAATIAAAVLGDTQTFAPTELGGLTSLYPLADMILLAMSVAAVVILGRAAGVAWWLLCGAFVVFVVADTIYASAAARGTYVAGGPLDLGWMVPRLGLLGTAWITARPGYESEHVLVRGSSVLVVPAVCLVLALGLLFYGTRSQVPPLAAGLALAAGALAVARTLMTFREVRDLSQVRREARTDELTGLANRRHFYDVLKEASTLLPRRPFAVVLVDLDRFKEVNDGFGHQVGDQLLSLVAERLAGVLRPGDVLARLGGDEYALLLPNASADDAVRIAQHARSDLQAPFTLGAATVVIDASLGVSLAPLHGSTPDELVAMADLAMYGAKAEGAGVVVYDELRHGGDLHRLERVAMLREGIRRGELEIHYQPQVALNSSETAGVEALVRWRHPEEGLLPPMAFLPLAESSGLMAELTTAVLDAALSQRRRWESGGIPLRIAVNVSPSALVDEDFPARVTHLLSAHGVEPTALVIELTEELLMDNRQQGVRALSELRSAGVRVSIDDYGTGYSSLAYLKDLPVNELKLDRSFVADLTSSTESAAIVQSTVDLAHALGLEIVAEGVEDAVTLQVLRQSGCDLAQGYLLGRPVPAEGVPGAIVHAATQASRRQTSAHGAPPE